MTGLAGLPGGGPHQYRAPDFDTLVDSPIIAGNPAVHEFTVDGKKHYLVNTPATETFDGARAAKDLEKAVGEYRRMWGSLCRTTNTCFRVRADRFDQRLEQYRPGERVSVLLARREQLMRLDVTLGAQPFRQWRLEIDPAADDIQKQRLTHWLQPATD